MAAKDSTGCSCCGSEKTVTVDGVCGRRCANCPPAYSAKHMAGFTTSGMDATPYGRTVATLPPGGYRPELADHMVELGRADAAFAYLGGWLTAAINRRFDLAVEATR